MSWSLRRRLTIAAVGGAAALTTVIGLAALTESWRRSNIERQQDLEFAVDRVAVDLTAEQIAGGRLPAGDDEIVAVFDADTQIIAASSNVDRPLVESLAADQLGVGDLGPDDIYFDTFDLGDDWDVVTIRCPETELCQSLLLGRRPAKWTSFVVSRLPESLGVLALVCAAVAVGASWLVKRSLRPVDRMRRELDTITAAQAAGRIVVPATKDELASLATSLNATVDRLADSLEAQRRFVSDSAHELRSCT